MKSFKLLVFKTLLLIQGMLLAVGCSDESEPEEFDKKEAVAETNKPFADELANSHISMQKSSFAARKNLNKRLSNGQVQPVVRQEQYKTLQNKTLQKKSNDDASRITGQNQQEHEQEAENIRAAMQQHTQSIRNALVEVNEKLLQKLQATATAKIKIKNKFGFSFNSNLFPKNFRNSIKKSTNNTEKISKAIKRLNNINDFNWNKRIFNDIKKETSNLIKNWPKQEVIDRILAKSNIAMNEWLKIQTISLTFHRIFAYAQEAEKNLNQAQAAQLNLLQEHAEKIKKLREQASNNYSVYRIAIDSE